MGSLLNKVKSSVKNLFKFNKRIETVTLFHKPQDFASSRMLLLLEDAQKSGARAHESTSKSSSKPRTEVLVFELDIIKAPDLPTPHQFSTILQFLGPKRINEVFKGVKDEKEAVKLLEEVLEGGDAGKLKGADISERFTRPLVVDWGNGKVVVGADEKGLRELVGNLNSEEGK